MASMNFKMLGGVLLVTGTSIGAGMLALPVATATFGVLGAAFFLVLIWFLMTYASFLVLEVNLWFEPKTNLISMSRETLGLPGQATAWLAYLLLLYCLLAAYISGGGDVLHHLPGLSHLPISEKWDAIIFTLLIASIVFQGISAVDHVNRYLMITKLSAFFFLIAVILPSVQIHTMARSELSFSMAGIVIIITSFGFATIVPSLRVYYDSDVRILKTVILLGGLIPLSCYLMWVGVIHGVLPLTGAHGLLAMLNQDHTTSVLMQSLTETLNNNWITVPANLFISLSVATSFLAVSLGLSDFLADGLKMPKVGRKKVMIFLLTFGPPLLAVLIDPNIFLKGLDYAGIFCVLLLALLPALMAWSGRYRKKIATGYRVKGGRIMLLLVIVASIILMTLGFRS